MQEQAIRTVVLGQRVHCILYGGKDGTVVRIDGEQQPGTIRSLFGGVGVMGGKAYFDIIWDNGSKSLGIPEAIMHGVQWRIYPTVVGQEAIAAAIANAACFDAKAKAEAEEASRKFAEGVVKIKDEFSFLITSDGKLGAGSKLAAANMRTELKRAFKGVKFSVRCSSYTSIRVEWSDGPTEDEVEGLLSKYEEGHFDGMEDIYRHTDTPWNTTFGSVKYLSTSRCFSDQLLMESLDKLYGRLPGNLKDIPKPDIKTLQGYGYTDKIPGIHLTVREAVWAIARSWNKQTNTFKVKSGDYTSTMLLED